MLSQVVARSGFDRSSKYCNGCKQSLPAIDVLEASNGKPYCRPCHVKIFRSCTACLDIVVDDGNLVELECGCKYCHDCLSDCFQAGLESVHTFPPKCCQKELSIHRHRDALPDAIIRKYITLRRLKFVKQRVACATFSCNKQRITHLWSSEDWALCTKCLQVTCARCGKLKAEHKEITINDRHCPNDDAVFANLVKKKKWTSCPKCNEVVSRSEGCNAMECRCGQEFCYSCGKAFAGSRDCACPVNYHPDDSEDEEETSAAEGAIVMNDTTFVDGPIPAGPATFTAGGGGVPVFDFPDEEWPNDGQTYSCHHQFVRTEQGELCQGCLQVSDQRQQCGTCGVIVCDACVGVVGWA